MKKTLSTYFTSPLRYGILLSLGLLLLLTGACTKDFEEINTDPQKFTVASDGSLFNAVIESLVPTGYEQFYIWNEILYKQTQQAALGSEAWGNYALGTEELWKNYYNNLPAVRELEKRFATYPQGAGVNNMKAMLKILLAYKTFKMTDYFGDIPFSEAGYGYMDLEKLYPPYDRQRDIYLSQLESLEEAAGLISDTAALIEPFKTFVKFDRLFFGDMLAWKKVANSLRLRYAMRMSDKEPEKAGEIIASIIQNNEPVITGYDFTSPLLEAACIWPMNSGFKNQSLNWSFREHKWLRMGSNMWHQLSANDNVDGSGIFDPRAYIFFEPNGDNQWVAFPQLPEVSTPMPGGVPYGWHRDDPGNFTIKGENCNYAHFNYFLIGDEDFMPIILMSGAEVHFIKAEAYMRGIGVPMDPDMADIEYMNGINTSVEWWSKVAHNSRLPLSGARFDDLLSIPAHLNASSVLMVFGSWNAQNDEEKLRYIYTQRWIDAFRQPSEAYALARRVALLPREGDPIGHFRLPYPSSESIYNTANYSEAKARQGGDSPETKIWLCH